MRRATVAGGTERTRRGDYHSTYLAHIISWASGYVTKQVQSAGSKPWPGVSVSTLYLSIANDDASRLPAVSGAAPLTPSSCGSQASQVNLASVWSCLELEVLPSIAIGHMTTRMVNNRRGLRASGKNLKSRPQTGPSFKATAVPLQHHNHPRRQHIPSD